MKGNNNPTRLPAAGACTRMNRYPSPEGAGLPAHSGILERYGRIGLETEEPAFAFEAIGHAPELADAGRVKRKSLPPSEYLWVCLRASNYGYEAGKRHGVFPGFCRMFRYLSRQKISNTALLSVRVSRFCIAWISPRTSARSGCNRTNVDDGKPC